MFTVQRKRREKTVCQSAILFLQASILISNAGTINKPRFPEKKMLCKVTHCSGCISASTRPHEQSVNKELLPTFPLSSCVRRTRGCRSHIIRLCELHFYVTIDGQGFGKKGLVKISL